MKGTSPVLILMFLASAFLINVPTVAGGGTVLMITPLKNLIEALPGETVSMPFQVKNLGNDTIGNVTVYVTGPVEGFVYQTKLIRIPIPPNRTINETLSVKVLTVPPGVYNLTIVARAGSFYTRAVVKVKIGLLKEYSLDISVGRKHVYGQEVRVGLSVVSKSNGILLGTIGYSIVRNGVKLVENESSTYLKPDMAWKRVITLKKPELGNYTVVLWANFGGRFRKVVRTFTVYRRRLSYRAYFRDGAITITVYNSSGGVPGVRVVINNIEFTTDDNGRVSYAVNRPGIYRVVLDLDGKVVTTFVEVKRLFISPSQKNSTLIVRVIDSNGVPVPNVTLLVSGPYGEEYAVTNSSGMASVNLNRTGYGTIILSTKSSGYIGGQAVVRVAKPTTLTHLPSPTLTQTTNLSLPQITTRGKDSNNELLSTILIVSGILLAGTSCIAFVKPLIHEESLNRYYFVKIRAPRLRPLRGYRFKRAVSAREVRVTKGTARIENGMIIWELDLEPGEEAQLQAVLG